MPQIFQVLCCYKCEMFQVHQVKKSNKWQCRVCNEKQSLKKAFKISSSRDCRSLVQELNMQKCGWVQEDKDLSPNSEGLQDSDDARNEETQRMHNSPEEECLSADDGELYSADEHDSTQQIRCLPDFDAEKLCKQDQAPIAKNISTQNLKTLKSSEWGPTSCDETVKDIDSSISKNPLKHPLEADSDVSYLINDAPPPFKRNRGFQFILKAAAKLS